MSLKLEVQLEGKDSDYERKCPPMLENLLGVLKTQRLGTEMFGGDKGPTDEQNAKRVDLYAEFVSCFWGQGLTKDDILKGVSAVDGSNQMVTAVSLTFSYNAEEDNKTKKSAKK